MSLADALLALQTPKGPVCGVSAFLDNLPDGLDRDEVEAVLDNPAIRYTTLASWIKTLPVAPIQSDTFSRHRKRECTCGRAR